MIQSKIATRLALGWFFIVVGMSIVGCGKASNLSGLAPAQGVVNYKGDPVEGASITFIPDGATSEQRPAAATTDAGGRFVMMTLQPKDGAFPGQYKVLITKAVPDKVYTQEEIQEFFRQDKPTPLPNYTHQLPEKYAKAETTPLTITLEQKGNTAITFDLVD